MPTILSDVVFRDELRDYIDVNSTERTAFFQSGILTSNSDMSTLLAGPSNTFTIPWWVDLDASIESNYSNDVYTDIAVPLSVSSADMSARAAYLNEGWAAMNLVKNITKQDPLEFVGRRLMSYWQRVAQRRTIATAVGIYNDNVDANGGDMVVDAGGTITAASIIRARGTMGDYSGQMGGMNVIAMHSAVHTELQILNLIDYTPIADQVPEFGRYQGMRVVVDDGMPLIAGVDPAPDKYLSIIFGPGAIGYAEEQPAGEDGLDYERSPDRGNGGGAETLWTRRNFVIHPLGFTFEGTTITGTPTTTRPISANWSDLALATNWTRKFDRKQVPMAFVTSNVAA
jgi:chloramphenicol 3-O-phosphotransferase